MSHEHRDVLAVGPLEVCPEDRLARLNGRVVALSGRELRILTELARRPDRVMSREELFALVWGRERDAGNRSVDVYVRRLRVKLEQALPGWRFIHTHFGFGYRLGPEPVTKASQASNTAPLASPQTLASS